MYCSMKRSYLSILPKQRGTLPFHCPCSQYNTTLPTKSNTELQRNVTLSPDKDSDFPIFSPYRGFPSTGHISEENNINTCKCAVWSNLLKSKIKNNTSLTETLRDSTGPSSIIARQAWLPDEPCFSLTGVIYFLTMPVIWTDLVTFCWGTRVWTWLCLKDLSDINIPHIEPTFRTHQTHSSKYTVT